MQQTRWLLLCVVSLLVRVSLDLPQLPQSCCLQMDDIRLVPQKSCREWQDLMKGVSGSGAPATLMGGSQAVRRGCHRWDSLHLRHEGVNMKAKNRTVVPISGLYDSETPFVGRSVDFLSDVLLTELRSMTAWSPSAGQDGDMDGDLHIGANGEQVPIQEWADRQDIRTNCFAILGPSLYRRTCLQCERLVRKSLINTTNTVVSEERDFPQRGICSLDSRRTRQPTYHFKG